MKFIWLLFFVMPNIFACPNFSGVFLCHDGNEHYILKISQDDNKFVFESQKGIYRVLADNIVRKVKSESGYRSSSAQAICTEEGVLKLYIWAKMKRIFAPDPNVELRREYYLNQKKDLYITEEAKWERGQLPNRKEKCFNKTGQDI